ncbi:SlyX family protein [Leptospira sp. SA-E8]
MLEQLNLLVYKQQQQIENLQRQIEQLRQQLPARDPGLDAGPRDERPPHY